MERTQQHLHNKSATNQEPMELTSKMSSNNMTHRKLSSETATMLTNQQLEHASRMLQPAEFLSFAKRLSKSGNVGAAGQGPEPLNLKGGGGGGGGGVSQSVQMPRTSLPHIVRGPSSSPPISTAPLRSATVGGTFYPPPGVLPMSSSASQKPTSQQQPRVSSASQSASALRHQPQAYARHHHNHPQQQQQQQQHQQTSRSNASTHHHQSSGNSVPMSGLG